MKSNLLRDSVLVHFCEDGTKLKIPSENTPPLVYPKYRYFDVHFISSHFASIGTINECQLKSWHVWQIFMIDEEWYNFIKLCHLLLVVYFLMLLSIVSSTHQANFSYRISSYSFLPWIVFSPWIVSSSSEEIIQVFIT